MDGIMVSAATGAMSSLLAKLADLLREGHQMQKGMRGEIAFLRDELSSMNALLERLADMEALDPQTKEWRNQVREMTYDIEDCVDDYMRQLQHEPQRPSGVVGFFLGYVQKVKELVARHDAAGQIQELRARIVEAGHRRKRYKIDDAVNSGGMSVVPVDRRLPALYAELGGLVGINAPRDEIIKLVDDGVQAVKVVSIVGCGGLGKTTVVNLVYRNIAEQFDCKAFVSLSQNPDMVVIFQSILSQVKKDECDITSSCDKERLISELRIFLNDKRYLIVIDDIWSSQAWNTIKFALVENTCGSRIIVTTRIGTIAKSCSSLRHDLVYELRMLSEDDSKMLFFRRIFGSGDKCPHQLKEVSTEIVRKCGGLPLAIITMASLLTTKSYTRADWLLVCNSIGSGLEKNWDVEEMNMILSLSYSHLPHHLRTCLLYLSMFPEDYVIKRDYLVRRWIAEGFVNAKGGRKLQDEGECYFNELINRSLIQPVDYQYDGRVYACRVHDMILDLIACKAVEENFVTVVTDRRPMLASQDKIHRLSLDFQGQGNVTSYLMVTAHVRSLNIFRYSKHIGPLSKFQALRVLDLDGNDNLKSSNLEDLGKLCQLRYLRIKASNIITLPEQIGELRFLEVLDLLNCPDTTELPSSIVKLQCLKWLIVPRVRLPEGIGNMHSLEFLSLIVVDYTTPITMLQELGSLTNLRTLGLDWRIGTHINKKTYLHNFVSSLGKLGTYSLQYLTLISPWSLEFLLDSWSPPPHLLQELGIKGWHLSKIPMWMSSLTNLTYLDIEVKASHETLQILGNFPSLLFLKIHSNLAIPEETFLFGSNTFRCLKKFNFIGWMNIMFEEGAMQVLEALEFQIAAHEAQSSCRFVHSDLGIHHLSALRNITVYIYCQGATTEEVEALESAIQITASMLPNHPVPALKRIDSAEMVKDNVEIERQRHSAPAWFYFNTLGSQSEQETTLNPVLDLHQDV